MPDASAEQTLQSYIDSLLGPSESEEPSANKEPSARINQPSAPTNQPSAVEEGTVPEVKANSKKAASKKVPSATVALQRSEQESSLAPLKAPQPTAPARQSNAALTSSKAKISDAQSASLPLADSGSNAKAHAQTHSKPAIQTQRKPKERIAELKTDDEASELREEQKARLQKLLSQETVRATQTKTSAAAVDLKDPIKLKQEIEEELEIALPEKVEPALDDVDIEVNETTFHDQAAQTLEWNENGRPAWAQERFDVLLFDVAGLTLAVPLVALGQIVRFEKGELTPIFGQSDWFMGLLSSSVGRLRVVNTSLFVMPEKYDESFTETAEYAISLDGVQWALAVNKVNQPITLEPSEIRWRSERSKRSWLAGTVKSHMCALLDIPQMANMLNESDKTLS